jgi:YidC/Oxa1 family membrane protein insertase
VLGMIIFFGLSLYVSQNLTGPKPDPAGSDNPEKDVSQQAVNKFTPIIFSGMFLFFPLPAGVLMYMVIGNVFQTIQTYIVSKEPLPADLQKIVDSQEQEKKSKEGRESLPFEKGKGKNSKKKATDS